MADLKESGELPQRLILRRSEYRTNWNEQDHQGIKQQSRPMLEWKGVAVAKGLINGLDRTE
ncbi:MAG: hypothetical protein NTV52_10380 [Acidobacteria bacterium]|nr:hypothetical protein [Acidobacteriota bacterium]